MYKYVLTVIILCGKIYFVFFIFVLYTSHKNIFATKTSRSTVLCTRKIIYHHGVSLSKQNVADPGRQTMQSGSGCHCLLLHEQDEATVKQNSQSKSSPKVGYHIYADNLQPFLGSYIATMATQTWTNLCRMILRLKVLLMHGDYLKQTQLMCQIASHLRAVRK